MSMVDHMLPTRSVLEIRQSMLKTQMSSQSPFKRIEPMETSVIMDNTFKEDASDGKSPRLIANNRTKFNV